MDVLSQLNKVGEQDSMGKLVVDIKQEGLPRPPSPTFFTTWDGIKKSHHYGGALIHQHGHASQPLRKVVACLSDLLLVLW